MNRKYSKDSNMTYNSSRPPRSPKTHTVWTIIARLCTILIPDFLLERIFNLQTKSAKTAWREKTTLFTMMILITAAFLFLMEWVGPFVCTSSNKNLNGQLIQIPSTTTMVSRCDIANPILWGVMSVSFLLLLSRVVSSLFFPLSRKDQPLKHMDLGRIVLFCDMTSPNKKNEHRCHDTIQSLLSSQFGTSRRDRLLYIVTDQNLTCSDTFKPLTKTILDSLSYSHQPQCTDTTTSINLENESIDLRCYWGIHRGTATPYVVVEKIGFDNRIDGACNRGNLFLLLRFLQRCYRMEEVATFSYDMTLRKTFAEYFTFDVSKLMYIAVVEENMVVSVDAISRIVNSISSSNQTVAGFAQLSPHINSFSGALYNYSIFDNSVTSPSFNETINVANAPTDGCVVYKVPHLIEDPNFVRIFGSVPDLSALSRGVLVSKSINHWISLCLCSDTDDDVKVSYIPRAIVHYADPAPFKSLLDMVQVSFHYNFKSISQTRSFWTSLVSLFKIILTLALPIFSIYLYWTFFRGLRSYYLISTRTPNSKEIDEEIDRLLMDANMYVVIEFLILGVIQGLGFLLQQQFKRFGCFVIWCMFGIPITCVVLPILSILVTPKHIFNDERKRSKSVIAVRSRGMSISSQSSGGGNGGPRTIRSRESSFDRGTGPIIPPRTVARTSSNFNSYKKDLPMTTGTLRDEVDYSHRHSTAKYAMRAESPLPTMPLTPTLYAADTMTTVTEQLSPKPSMTRHQHTSASKATTAVTNSSSDKSRMQMSFRKTIQSSKSNAPIASIIDATRRKSQYPVSPKPKSRLVSAAAIEREKGPRIVSMASSEFMTDDFFVDELTSTMYSSLMSDKRLERHQKKLSGEDVLLADDMRRVIFDLLNTQDLNEISKDDIKKQLVILFGEEKVNKMEWYLDDCLEEFTLERLALL